MAVEEEEEAEEEDLQLPQVVQMLSLHHQTVLALELPRHQVRLCRSTLNRL
jgi:hypothetical protein